MFSFGIKNSLLFIYIGGITPKPPPCTALRAGLQAGAWVQARAWVICAGGRWASCTACRLGFVPLCWVVDVLPCGAGWSVGYGSTTSPTGSVDPCMRGSPPKTQFWGWLRPSGWYPAGVSSLSSCAPVVSLLPSPLRIECRHFYAGLPPSGRIFKSQQAYRWPSPLGVSTPGSVGIIRRPGRPFG